MSSGFSRSPQLLKGALVVYESHDPGSNSKVIAFQYNPAQVSRSISHTSTANAQPGGAGASRGQAQEDVLRVERPPQESINLSITLNAADQLEFPDSNRDTVDNGLHTVLATLEMLLYPTSFQVLQNEALADAGEVQLNPADLPLTLLVWGRSRVVPVKITNFSVTEEAFDPRLNPIQAKVELGLRVLNYMDLPADSAGRDIYLAYQQRKEGLANQYQAGQQEQQIRDLIPGG